MNETTVTGKSCSKITFTENFPEEKGMPYSDSAQDIGEATPSPTRSLGIELTTAGAVVSAGCLRCVPGFCERSRAEAVNLQLASR